MTIAVGDARPQSGAPGLSPADLTPAARSVLDELHSRADRAGEVTVTAADLACTLGLTVRTVRRATGQITRFGLAVLLATPGAANRFLLTPDQR